MSVLTVLSSSNKSIDVIYDDLNNSQYNDLDFIKNNVSHKSEFSKFGTLNIENIAFNYPNKKYYKNVSFTVQTGEIVGLIGQSGSGKSTLVDLIIGILEINKGSIKYNNTYF